MLGIHFMPVLLKQKHNIQKIEQMDIYTKQKCNVHKKQKDWTYAEYMEKMFYKHTFFWIKLLTLDAYVQFKKKVRTLYKKKIAYV